MKSIHNVHFGARIRLFFGAVVLSATLLSVTTVPGRAQAPTEFTDPDDASQIRTLIENLLADIDNNGIPKEIDQYAVGGFAQVLEKSPGGSLFPPGAEYRIEEIRSIREGDTLGVTTVSVATDSLPFFGQVTVDWVFFTSMTPDGWRISDVRRFVALDGRMDELRFIDTSAAYPTSLKPIVAREASAALLSNRQLAEHFRRNRIRFDQLIGIFNAEDSLKMVARIGNEISQINFHTIQWEEGAYSIPQIVIDEYMTGADPEAQKQMQIQLRRVERLRTAGRDTLKGIARSYGINEKRIDSLTVLMNDLRFTFINTILPWPDAVQITVAGELDDAVGYLYSPTGALPYVSPEEYFYLESLGDGWWIFRST